MLELCNVTRLSHGMPVFTPVSVVLRPGEALWVQGSNGSGKTTLLRIVSGLLSHEGEVRWQGNNIHDCQSNYAQSMAYLGHRHGLYENLDGIANLQRARAWQVPGHRDTTEAQTALGFAAFSDRSVAELSEGQSRKVAWLRLLQSGASIWYLDEPFNALDADSRDYLIGQCQQHLSEGGVLVLTSHQAHAVLPRMQTIALGRS